MYNMACGITLKDQGWLDASESSGGRILSLRGLKKYGVNLINFIEA